MKKILLALMPLLGAFTANAQWSSITITNSTGCDVYLELHGDISGSNCTKQNYSSAIFSVPSGTYTFDPSTVPGGMNCGGCTLPSLGALDIIWSALIYKGYPCAGTNTTTFLLQDNNCTSNKSAGFTDYNAACKVCSPVTNVTWTNNGSSIDLKFL